MKKFISALLLALTVSSIVACKTGVYYPRSEATAYQTTAAEAAPIPTAHP